MSAPGALPGRHEQARQPDVLRPRLFEQTESDAGVERGRGGVRVGD